MKVQMTTVKTVIVALSALAGAATPALAAAGNCQHPYCSMSSGYDAEHGIVDLSSSEAPSNESPSDRLKDELNQVGVERFTEAGYKPGLVRHIVLFRYAPSVTPEQKAEVKKRFLALKTQSLRNGRPLIASIETGGELSGEGADQGLEQGFIVTFRSQGDRNYYVGQPVVTDSSYYDPAHQAFKDFVGPLLDQNGALVFDFAI